MKHKIVQNHNGLDVEITDVRENNDQLLGAFQECAQGRCSCPTQEYTKLSELHIEQQPNKIILHLTAKEGQQLDQSEIERCFDHTHARIEGRT